jgi:hypothetical protein
MLQGKLTNLMIGCAPQRVNPNRHGKPPRRRGGLHSFSAGPAHGCPGLLTENLNLKKDLLYYKGEVTSHQNQLALCFFLRLLVAIPGDGLSLSSSVS